MKKSMLFIYAVLI